MILNTCISLVLSLLAMFFEDYFSRLSFFLLFFFPLLSNNNNKIGGGKKSHYCEKCQKCSSQMFGFGKSLFWYLFTSVPSPLKIKRKQTNKQKTQQNKTNKQKNQTNKQKKSIKNNAKQQTQQTHKKTVSPFTAWDIYWWAAFRSLGEIRKKQEKASNFS